MYIHNQATCYRLTECKQASSFSQPGLTGRMYFCSYERLEGEDEERKGSREKYIAQ